MLKCNKQTRLCDRVDWDIVIHDWCTASLHTVLCKGNPALLVNYNVLYCKNMAMLLVLARVLSFITLYYK